MNVGKNYTAVFRELSPYVIVNDQTENSGFMIQFLRVLKRLDSVNVTVIPSNDKFWGAKVGNSWNGLLGMLERNEGDFSLVPLTLSTDRFNAFPISHPFLLMRTQIVFGTNQRNENNIYSVVDKLIIVTLFGVALLIYMTGKLNAKYGKVKSEVPWMFLLQCLMGTSPQSVRCKGVARFISVLWSLACFVLLVFVSSEMTSEFSSISAALPFDSMDDIFHFPDAYPVLTQGTAVFSFIQKNALTNPAFAELTKRAESNRHSCFLERSGFVKNSKIHSEIESRETFIIESDIIIWNLIMARYHETGICKMKLSKPLMTTYKTMYFKKNISETLIKTVNRRLRQLTEGDCFEDLDPSLNVESHPCQKTERPNAFVVVNVHAFMIIFCVCLFGFSVSLVTLILEIYVNMLKTNQVFQKRN